MRYISTRGQAKSLDFDGVLRAGLAEDGGLYLPEDWPQLDLEALQSSPYTEIAHAVMQDFVADDPVTADLSRIISESAAQFRHQEVAPLVQLTERLWLMELYHGPTLAFKDVALQILGRLFDHSLKRSGEQITVIGATSGDTGSAAIEACRGREAVDVFIFYPQGRISEVQRRQMTTVPGKNLHCLAIEGSFDDCQDLVKALFNAPDLRRSLNLTAVNSINWARIMAQIPYYVAASLRLGGAEREIAFAVPTGNFGNIFAAYAAVKMGLASAGLILGSNHNDILTRFFETGEMRPGAVTPSHSPSMDIQISSNFERYLFMLLEGDSQKLGSLMQQFRTEGHFRLGDSLHAMAQSQFQAFRVSDEDTLSTIRYIYEKTGIIIDPHTAVGVRAALSATLAPDIPIVSLGCAHPAKFPDAVERAIGLRPELPPHLADLFDRPERVTVLPNDFQAVSGYIQNHARICGA